MAIFAEKSSKITSLISCQKSV